MITPLVIYFGGVATAILLVIASLYDDWRKGNDTTLGELTLAIALCLFSWGLPALFVCYLLKQIDWRHPVIRGRTKE